MTNRTPSMTDQQNLLKTLPEDCQKILTDSSFDMKVSLFIGHWTVDDCQKYSDSLFIFGDNDYKQGAGGQAVIRNCKNTMGIPTKRFPNNKSTSFYTDYTYDENCQKILNAVIRIVRESVNYRDLTFPEKGFGVGLARLPEKAPKTHAYLEKLIDDCFGIDYVTLRKDGLKPSVCFAPKAI